MNTSERSIEQHFIWAVLMLGGKTYKFRSVTQNGVADRIACLPDGSTWFVEIKQAKGKLSKLQTLFAADVIALRQTYACLRSKEDINEWMYARKGL